MTDEPVDRNVVKCRNCGELLEDVSPGGWRRLDDGRIRVVLEGWCRRIPCLGLRWEFSWTVGDKAPEPPPTPSLFRRD